MIEALYVPAILLAVAISGAVIVAAELLRAFELTATPANGHRPSE